MKILGGQQRAVCIAVGQVHLEELHELLRTADVESIADLVQVRDEPHPDTYFGKGKIRELEDLVSHLNADLVVCDDELSPRQERNLENSIKVPVVDRTAVILDIFATHAHTAEGKLQVELAQLQYNMARMRGLWTHLERLGGGVGTRGPGETQIETDRRLARNRIASLTSRVTALQKRRQVMRAERERTQMPTVALAGYTNAGKSTLLNALTGAEVGVEDSLFHTLDPTTRNLEIHGRTYLLTDTVGFIRKLPHQLVDAFAATLEETVHADLLIEVADASLPFEELEDRMSAVAEVLDEIGANESPLLLALNKIDLISNEQKEQLGNLFPHAYLISTSTGEGIEALLNAIEAHFVKTLVSFEALLPYNEGSTLAQLHTLDPQLVREETSLGVKIKARIPAKAANRLARFSINANEQ